MDGLLHTPTHNISHGGFLTPHFFMCQFSAISIHTHTQARRRQATPLELLYPEMDVESAVAIADDRQIREPTPIHAQMRSPAKSIIFSHRFFQFF